MVLNVEKPVRKLDVVPILVDNVLNDDRQTLDKLAMDVDRVESCLPMSLLALVSPITVDKEEIPDWSVKKLVVITVLKVDMVETSCPVKVEVLDPSMVEKEENPAWREAKFVAITVLKVEIVETSWAVKVELFDPPMVEKEENPACREMRLILMRVLRVDIVESC